MAGVENDQVLYPTNNFPVPCLVDFALVPSAKPAIAQNFGGFICTLPISGEDVWSANDDFFVFTKLHLNPGNSAADPPRLNVPRVVHRANGGGLRQPIHLQDRYAQHHEIELRFYGQRRRSADQGLKVRSNHLFPDGWKHQLVCDAQPYPVR